MKILYKITSVGLKIWCDEDTERCGYYAIPDNGVNEDYLMGLIAGAEIFGQLKVDEIVETE